MKAPLMLIGIVVLAAGLVFVGQGLGYIRWPASSFMISEIKWAYYGGGIVRSLGFYSLSSRTVVEPDKDYARAFTWACPGQPSNTSCPHFLRDANRAGIGNRKKARREK